jgi:hypothetical protein
MRRASPGALFPSTTNDLASVQSITGCNEAIPIPLELARGRMTSFRRRRQRSGLRKCMNRRLPSLNASYQRGQPVGGSQFLGTRFDPQIKVPSFGTCRLHAPSYRRGKREPRDDHSQ